MSPGQLSGSRGVGAIEADGLIRRIAELHAEVDPTHRLGHVPGLGYFPAAALTSAILWLRAVLQAASRGKDGVR